MALTEEERKKHGRRWYYIAKRKDPDFLEKQRLRQEKYRDKNRDAINARRRVARLKDPENYREKELAYSNTRKPRIRELAREHYIRNQQKHLIRTNKYRKEHRGVVLEHRKDTRDELGDSYVKDKLIRGTQLKANDVPQDLIKLKRQQLRLHRTIREVQKCR